MQEDLAPATSMMSSGRGWGLLSRGGGARLKGRSLSLGGIIALLVVSIVLYLALWDGEPASGLRQAKTTTCPATYNNHDCNNYNNNNDYHQVMTRTNNDDN